MNVNLAVCFLFVLRFALNKIGVSCNFLSPFLLQDRCCFYAGVVQATV